MIKIPKMLQNYRYCTQWSSFIPTYIFGISHCFNERDGYLEKTNYFTRLYNTALKKKVYVKYTTGNNGKHINIYHYDWLARKCAKN